MALRSLTIHGLRGFATRQTLRIAQPTGDFGSGLTILVGPNNGGKSTIVEAFRALATQDRQSFTEGKRNKRAGDRVELSLEVHNGDVHTLQTVDTGGSETAREPDRGNLALFVLPSRRYFSPYFGRDYQKRQTYIQHVGFPQTRGAALDQFSGRLFQVLAERDSFDEVLGRVLNPVPEWTIDQAESGNYYLKFNSEGEYHTSDGLGEGIVSLFFIIDALYDSSAGEAIVIDEPELSLHPALQRKLANVLADYARDRQIIYGTHSPYFADFAHIAKGAELARVYRAGNSSVVSQLSRDTAAAVGRFLGNANNPHILGLDAREVLFMEDSVVLVEGQEDVVFMSKMLAASHPQLTGHIYGWGVGGADNICIIAALLSDLGFRRVAGIVDANKAGLVNNLRAQFPNYMFEAIVANDIRTKPASKAKDAVIGLLDERGEVRAEYAEATATLFDEVQAYLKPAAAD